MSTELPPLPDGFTSRNASPADVQLAAQAGIDYALATTGFSDTDAESLLTEWQAPGFDPGQDIKIIFSPDGRLAGYVEVWANMTPPVHPFIWGFVPPEFQNLGIGSHILAWSERRAARVLETVPADIRVAPITGVPNVIEAARALLQDNGWSHIRSYYSMRIDMDAPPPAAVFAPGISLQTYQPEKAEAIFRSFDEAFEDHFGHVQQPFEQGFERFQHNLKDPHFDGSLWFLAMDGEQIAGVALCRPRAFDDPDSGYVNILGVRRPWRKQGLGLALLQHAFGEFYRRGYRKVGLGVDAQNITGALRLYEKAGMHVIRQVDLYEKELRPGRELRVQGSGA